MTASAYDAVVLAGGAARRLGGRDKVAEVVGAGTLLDRVLAAVADAASVVVVGPQRPVVGRVTAWVREQPPGGGPVAAVAAGLAAATAPAVVVLAGDLAFPSAAVVRRLLQALTGDGVLVVDADGRDQSLFGAWGTAALRAGLAGLPDSTGASMRSVVAGLDVRRLEVLPASGEPPPWLDCDTEADLLRARELAGTPCRELA